MTVRISLGGIDASVDSYEWISTDAALEEILNARRDPLGPSPSDPDCDYTLARAAILALGGQIISADEPGYEDNVVY